MAVNFKALRAANIARQLEWPGNERANPAFRTLEVADEVGEIMGAVKKWLRAERDIAGTTMTVKDVADEIGDALISLDLLMWALELPPIPTTMPKPPGPKAKTIRIAIEIFVTAGHVADSFLAYDNAPTEDEKEARRFQVRDDCLQLLIEVERLAMHLGINTNAAVIAKFNKTSVKYGMATRMEEPCSFKTEHVYNTCTTCGADDAKACKHPDGGSK